MLQNFVPLISMSRNGIKEHANDTQVRFNLHNRWQTESERSANGKFSCRLANDKRITIKTIDTNWFAIRSIYSFNSFICSRCGCHTVWMEVEWHQMVPRPIHSERTTTTETLRVYVKGNYFEVSSRFYSEEGNIWYALRIIHACSESTWQMTAAKPQTPCHFCKLFIAKMTQLCSFAELQDAWPVLQLANVAQTQRITQSASKKVLLKRCTFCNLPCRSSGWIFPIHGFLLIVILGILIWAIKLNGNAYGLCLVVAANSYFNELLIWWKMDICGLWMQTNLFGQFAAVDAATSPLHTQSQPN